jgi:hypothetical protein
MLRQLLLNTFFSQFTAFISGSSNNLFIQHLPQSAVCISSQNKINPSKLSKPKVVSDITL